MRVDMRLNELLHFSHPNYHPGSNRTQPPILRDDTFSLPTIQIPHLPLIMPNSANSPEHTFRVILMLDGDESGIIRAVESLLPSEILGVLISRQTDKSP